MASLVSGQRMLPIVTVLCAVGCAPELGVESAAQAEMTTPDEPPLPMPVPGAPPPPAATSPIESPPPPATTADLRMANICTYQEFENSISIYTVGAPCDGCQIWLSGMTHQGYRWDLEDITVDCVAGGGGTVPDLNTADDVQSLGWTFVKPAQTGSYPCTTKAQWTCIDEAGKHTSEKSAGPVTIAVGECAKGKWRPDDGAPASQRDVSLGKMARGKKDAPDEFETVFPWVMYQGKKYIYDCPAHLYPSGNEVTTWSRTGEIGFGANPDPTDTIPTSWHRGRDAGSFEIENGVALGEDIRVCPDAIYASTKLTRNLVDATEWIEDRTWVFSEEAIAPTFPNFDTVSFETKDGPVAMIQVCSKFPPLGTAMPDAPLPYQPFLPELPPLSPLPGQPEAP